MSIRPDASSERSRAPRSATLVDTVLINGSVGTGKTTTAEGVGAELRRLGIPGAVIDVDQLRRAWPAPPGDPFLTALATQNLRAIAANYRRVGARVLVVATVAETVDELRSAAVALSAEKLLHVRLIADADAVLSRLAGRHAEDHDALLWHVRRHPELARILDRAGFEGGLVIDTTTASASDVVREVVTTILR